MTIIKVRHSIESKHQLHAKDYGFLSFTKNRSKNTGTHSSNKYNQKPLDSATKSTTVTTKTDSERVIQKKNSWSNWWFNW